MRPKLRSLGHIKVSWIVCFDGFVDASPGWPLSWPGTVTLSFNRELSGARRFCFSCILSWSGRQNRCPCCRARFGVIRRNPLDLEALPQCTGKGTVDHYPGQILEEVPVPDRDPVSFTAQPCDHLLKLPNC